jgi:hypothetical protein
MTGPDYQTWLDHLFGHLDNEPDWNIFDDFEFAPTCPQTLNASE